MTTERPVHLERQWAAELARVARRAARRGDVDSASDMLDWALLLVPEARAIERLRIELLVKEHHLDHAEAMLERRLLKRSNDAGLLLLRARCSFLKGNVQRANEDLTRVAAAGTERRDVATFAAEVATALGDHARAAELLSRLLAQRPSDERVLLLLIRALIESKDVDNAARAERLLGRLSAPPATLLARCCLIQGRFRDAVDCLEQNTGAMAGNDGNDSDESNTLYAEALELCGDTSRIAEVATRVYEAGYPGAMLAMARIMLAKGWFRQAIGLAIRVSRGAAFGKHQGAALALLASASVLSGRTRLARSAVRRLALLRSKLATTSEVTRCWRRGFLGRAMLEQRAAVGAASGSDPSPSVLRTLLSRAVAVAEDRLRRSDNEQRDDSRRLEEDLELCRASLGPA